MDSLVRLVDILEARHGIRVVGDEAYRWIYTRDYWPRLVFRDIREGIEPRNIYIAYPEDEGEVLKILNEAHRLNVRIYVYGGGSGVLGGAIPSGDGLIIDTSRLRWIRWLDEYSGIIDVGPGTYMSEVEDWLNRRGYTTRHYPQSIDVATIGGLVSTLSIGQYSTGYGGIEDMVLGLNIAIPGLGIVKIPPRPRRSTLIQLDKLFIGGEALYGVLTRIYLRVLRLPEYVARFIYKTSGFTESVKKAKMIIDRNIYPHLFRIFDEYESSIYFPDVGWGSVILGIFEGEREIVDAYIRYVDGRLGDRVPLKYFDEWYRERNNVLKMVKALYESGLGFDTVELGVSWSRVNTLYRDIRENIFNLEGVKGVTAHIGHFYPSGVGIYFTFTIDLARYEETYDPLWDTVMDIARRHGASISHHHGLGIHRLRYLKYEYGLEGFKLLKIIKDALDRGNILRGSLDDAF